MGAAGNAAVTTVLFDLDVLACPRCGGRLRVIATVQDPRAVQAILAHLDRAGAPAPPGSHAGVRRGRQIWPAAPRPSEDALVVPMRSATGSTCSTPSGRPSARAASGTGGRRLDLIAFEHSLYYCPADRWRALLSNVFDVLLAKTGAIHCVLMSSSADNPATTTWLYNHFAGKFFGHRNDQDLRAFGRGSGGIGASRERRSSPGRTASASSWTTSGRSCPSSG
jgi:uncharacterized protein YbaR (Trm112 family)